MDKWDIKPFAFKEGAGFISEKAGLSAELELLSQLIQQGRTAILNDLTTCLKHGDVTEIRERLPILYEVTSGRGLSARKYRQAENASTVLRFIRDDAVNGLYGRPHHVHRVALHSEERHHRPLFNELVARARRDGSAWAEPERGLRYVILTSESIREEEAFFAAGSETVAVFANELKYATLAHLPFPLTWDCPSSLFEWYKGNLLVTILMDLRIVRDLLAARGLELEQRDNSEYPLWLISKANGNDAAQLGVSWQLYARLFTECTSLEWFVAELICRYSSEINRR